MELTWSCCCGRWPPRNPLGVAALGVDTEQETRRTRRTANHMVAIVYATNNQPHPVGLSKVNAPSPLLPPS